MKVCSAQFNFQYGNQVHFPYSIATLVASCLSHEDLKHISFEKTFVFRWKMTEYLARAKSADVLLCSCYVWNWQITNHLARAVRAINPDCLIVFGGPQVPDEPGDFFQTHPYVDLLVHGEGELLLPELLREARAARNFARLVGVSSKEFHNGRTPRIEDLSALPSPYTSNLVWDLVEREPGIQFVASWETNRGCPYQCTFCDWGGATYTKLRNFSDERLHAEIRWFAENQIVYVDFCDSNFGILPRDLELARLFKEAALEHKYPLVVRQSWAKNSSAKIIPVARELYDGGLLSAVGLSLQSLDQNTLEIVKRKNIKFEKFSELTSDFRNAGLPTYTEIIRGMPGETLQSFKAGLELLVGNSDIGAIFIYDCAVLPNAALNHPEYRRRYAVESIRSPVLLKHSLPEERGIEEYEEIVVGASSYTLAELKEMYAYSWAVLTFFSLGILEYVAQFYHRECKLEYLRLCDLLMEYCRRTDGLFAAEFRELRSHIDVGYSGGGWNHVDPELGRITWPIEEASWLRLCADSKTLTAEIEAFLGYLEQSIGIEFDASLREDLARFQVFLLSTKDRRAAVRSESFEHDWKAYFADPGARLCGASMTFFAENACTQPDDVQWNYQAVWFGRRKRHFKKLPRELSTSAAISPTPTICSLRNQPPGDS